MEASMKVSVFIALVSAVLLASCTQRETGQASPDANAPHATVVTRDGATVTGVVSSSTPSEITVNMDSGGSRTILTKDVRSVQYDEAPANAASRAANPPAKASPPAASTAANA